MRRFASFSTVRHVGVYTRVDKVRGRTIQQDTEPSVPPPSDFVRGRVSSATSGIPQNPLHSFFFKHEFYGSFAHELIFPPNLTLAYWSMNLVAQFMNSAYCRYGFTYAQKRGLSRREPPRAPKRGLSRRETPRNCWEYIKIVETRTRSPPQGEI